MQVSARSRSGFWAPHVCRPHVSSFRKLEFSRSFSTLLLSARSSVLFFSSWPIRRARRALQRRRGRSARGAATSAEPPRRPTGGAAHRWRCARCVARAAHARGEAGTAFEPGDAAPARAHRRSAEPLLHSLQGGAFMTLCNACGIRYKPSGGRRKVGGELSSGVPPPHHGPTKGLWATPVAAVVPVAAGALAGGAAGHPSSPTQPSSFAHAARVAAARESKRDAGGEPEGEGEGARQSSGEDVQPQDTPSPPPLRPSRGPTSARVFLSAPGRGETVPPSRCGPHLCTREPKKSIS